LRATDLLELLRPHRLAVEASVSPTRGPQSAVVGIAVTDRFEIVFDTLSTSRKAQNLRRNPKVALVIGGMTDGQEYTIQYEGVADEPAGAELERVQRAYYRVYPDGPRRLSWPALIYVRVQPTWVRYSNYHSDPPEIVEFTAEQLVI
jgi:hypothetical protein